MEQAEKEYVIERGIEITSIHTSTSQTILE